MVYASLSRDLKQYFKRPAISEYAILLSFRKNLEKKCCVTPILLLLIRGWLFILMILLQLLLQLRVLMLLPVALLLHYDYNYILINIIASLLHSLMLLYPYKYYGWLSDAFLPAAISNFPTSMHTL